MQLINTLKDANTCHLQVPSGDQKIIMEISRWYSSELELTLSLASSIAGRSAANPSRELWLE